MPSTEPRFTARERSQMETHRRLLEHGTRLFASQGISRARATDIARAASVAVGTLYLHFKDKDGVRVLVWQHPGRAAAFTPAVPAPAVAAPQAAGPQAVEPAPQ